MRSARATCPRSASATAVIGRGRPGRSNRDTAGGGRREHRPPTGATTSSAPSSPTEQRIDELGAQPCCVRCRRVRRDRPGAALAESPSDLLTRPVRAATVELLRRVVSSAYQVAFPRRRRAANGSCARRRPRRATAWRTPGSPASPTPTAPSSTGPPTPPTTARQIAPRLLLSADLRHSGRIGWPARPRATRAWHCSRGWSAAGTWRCAAPTGRTSAWPRSPDGYTWTEPQLHARTRAGLGDAAGRQLRAADRDRPGLAGAHPRRRTDAPVRDRRDPARPGRPERVLGRLERAVAAHRATASRTATSPTSSTPAAGWCTTGGCGCPTASATRGSAWPGRRSPNCSTR